MSWLSKVTDIAGAAENLLNRLDERTGDAIQTVQVQTKSRSRRQSTAHTAVNIPEHVITEDVGRPSNSIPSRAHSDYTGTNKPRSDREKSRDNWSVVLNARDVISTDDQGVSRSRRSSETKSFITVTDYEADTQSADACSVRSQIFARDSQITVMKAKLMEMEKKFEKRSQDYFELKADKELLEQRLSTVVASNDASATVEELKLSKKKTQEQKEQMAEERNALRRKVVSLEEEIRAMIEQLRLAKFNLNENKKEFDEYKTKAQKILSAKEKLVESLKNEHDHSLDGPGPVLLAEVEELRVERDLAKSDLESCQLQLYTLKSDAEELDAQLRDLKNQLSDQRRNYFDEKQSWSMTSSHLNEQVECARLECDFAKKELKKKTEEFEQKLAQKDSEIRNAIDMSKNRRREEETRVHDSNAQMGELLLQKQKELEDAQRTNQVLTVRLDRLQRAQRETAIPVEASSSQTTTQFLSSVKNVQTRQLLTAIDVTAIKVMTTLRNYPAARILFVVYFLILHLWLFFIVLTYTPEAH